MNATNHLFRTTMLCCALLLPVVSTGQIAEKSTEKSDFQARTGFSIDKKAVAGLHITWSEELRLKDALGKIDRIYSVLAVSYEFCPWFKAGADYNFIAVKRDEGWEFRNRSNIDLTASYKPAPRWRLSLRERFRITSTNKRSDPALEANPAWIMRSRLMAEYDVRPLPIRPYVYLELSNTLNAPNITRQLHRQNPHLARGEIRPVAAERIRLFLPFRPQPQQTYRSGRRRAGAARYHPQGEQSHTRYILRI